MHSTRVNNFELFCSNRLVGVVYRKLLGEPKLNAIMAIRCGRMCQDVVQRSFDLSTACLCLVFFFVRHEIAAARYTVESQLVGVLRHGIEVTKH